MVGEVIAGLGAFKTIFDIAKSMKDMDDTVRRNAAVFDLWEQITAIQTRYTAAVEQVSDLEKQLASFETWETEKQRYKLTELCPGVMAYTLKAGMEEWRTPSSYLWKLLSRPAQIDPPATALATNGVRSSCLQRLWRCSLY